MKKLSFIVIILLSVFAFSCTKSESGNSKIDKTQLVGRWMTADTMYFEVYYSDGTGKEWDLNDDVQEEEAMTFTWEFDNATDNKFIKYYPLEIGSGVVPQYCNILELTSTNFKYNNDGLRATYNLVRAN